MAMFKCKMCGGSLEVQDGVTVCECEYCGSKQTIPNNSDENIRALFNRANVLRMKAEFDKAEDLYEKILQLNSTEAEAYWGLILCKYGVEYVEDPKTMRRVPTCHRTSYDAIAADDDYKNALYYASIEQKIVYEEEAKSIDDIQKGILLISQQEDPYDVFICYKEADENGRRTRDSVIANDIYYQLTQHGYKVFYAAITLEDKLGSEYEPYIFSALNSAKVMLVLGTKPEYFNAVWVKNEWSRFLKIMKKDRSKLLIPCFRDMDAYELPEEFAHLQAQDMSKIGFINDIVRGIQKVLRKDNAPANKSSSNSNTENSAALPLIKRAYMCLEDGEWNKADDFCEQALNIDPENALAYVGKLMALLQVHDREELKNQPEPFSGNNDYKKAVRFADEELKKELQGYITSIEYRNSERVYDRAVKLMNKAKAEDDYSEAAKLFKTIKGHKDAADLIDKCHELERKMHVDGLIKQARDKLDNAYSEMELLRAIAEISEGKDIPEIAELIRKAKDDYAERIPIAMQRWNEYLPVRKEIAKLEEDIKAIQANITECKNKRTQVKQKAKENRQKKESTQKISESIQSANMTLRDLEKKINQEKSELSKLGFFAMGAKKEINARISDLQARIDKEKRGVADLQKQYDQQMKEVEQFPSEAAIEQELDSLWRSISESEKLEAEVTEQYQTARYNFGERLSAFVAHKYLAALLSTTEFDLFKSILADSYVATEIKTNTRLLEIAQGNHLFDILPLQIKQQFRHRKGEGLDVEAIYFQACQALEYPSGDDDILWAKEQFLKISGYKDADSRVSECNRRIAGA